MQPKSLKDFHLINDLIYGEIALTLAQLCYFCYKYGIFNQLP